MRAVERVCRLPPFAEPRDVAIRFVMNHRIRKLLHKLKNEGLRSAAGFVAKDFYFRALSALAFPFGRARSIPGSGRDPFREFVENMSALPSGEVLEIGARAVSDTIARTRFPSTITYT